MTLVTVSAVGFGYDLNRHSLVPVLLLSDKPAAKVAICRETPKSRKQYGPHVAVGPIAGLKI